MMEIDSPHPQGIYCIISGHRNCFLEEPRKYLFGHSHTKPIDIFLFDTYPRNLKRHQYIWVLIIHKLYYFSVLASTYK